MVPALFLFYVLGYLDRVNIGFAKLEMLSDLGWSDSIYGLGAGMFFIGYFVFEVPSNIILYRLGARRWLGCLMIVWGLLSACMMFVKTEFFFYLLRFALGSAEAGFFPGIIFYLTIWFPKQRRGRVTALFMSAIGISGIVGGPLSGWIMQTFHNVHGLSGWQWLFVLEGLPSVAMGFLALVILDDSIRQAKWLSEDEKAILERNIAQDQSQQVTMPMLQVLTLGRVWLLGLVYFLFITGLYGVGFWMPQIIKSSGVTNVLNIGLLSAIPPAASIVVMVLVGRHSDRTGERRWHLAWSGFAAGTGLVLCGLLGHFTLGVMIGLTIASAGVLTAISLFWSLPTEFLSGAAAAVGIGLINSIGNLAGFVSPSVMGYLNDKTHNAALGLYPVAVCVSLGSVVALITSKTLKRADAPVGLQISSS